MHKFQCGHQECGSQYTAADREFLMMQVAQHLKDAHAVNAPTQTLMSYLEATCVTTESSSR